MTTPSAPGFRPAGRTGLVLPELSLGLWHGFGDTTPFERQRAIVLRAFELGIVHFDGANRYGPPFRAAEKNLGRVLARDLRDHREEIVISTKAGNPIGDSPYLRGGSRKSLLGSLAVSLRDLGVEYVDVFYSHSPDPATPVEETAAALADAVRQGKALYVGISNRSAPDAAALAAALTAEGVPLALHQPRYSIFDRRVEEEGLLDRAEEDGTGVIVYSPLAQGLLTDKYLDEIPAEARVNHSAFIGPEAITDDYRRRARALNDIAKERGQSLAQLALLWTLRDARVTSALIGASSTTQLEHNLRALEGAPLTEDELRRIDEHSR